MGDVATKIPARKESLKGLAGKALHKHCTAHAWTSENDLWESLSTLWVLVIELRLPNLASNTFTH